MHRLIAYFIIILSNIQATILFMYCYTKFNDYPYWPSILLLFFYLYVLIRSNNEDYLKDPKNITVEQFFKVRIYVLFVIFWMYVVFNIYDILGVQAYDDEKAFGYTLNELLRLTPLFILLILCALLYIIKFIRMQIVATLDALSNIINNDKKFIVALLGIEIGVVICITALKAIS